MKIKNITIEPKVVFFLLLFLLWYISGIYLYQLEAYFPVVHIGPDREWPLLFFLHDFLFVFILFGLFVYIYRTTKNKNPFMFVLMILLFWYPAIIIFATISDLYMPYCIDLQPVNNGCAEYMPNPDWGNIWLTK